MKSKNCSHDVQGSDEHCGICGAEVVLESEISTMKKCPNCNDLQNPKAVSCTTCQIKLFTCIGKKKDGSNCEAFLAETQNLKFCKGCGSPVNLVKKDADELDSRKQTQVTQPTVIAGPTRSPKEKKTGPGDVAIGNHNQNADGPKVKEEIDSRELKREATTKKCATRGLAVICTHQKFQTEKYDVTDRNIAPIDSDLMAEVWELYGCEILRCKDGTKEFYMEKLISEIEDKLKEIGSIDYFVFVLSTHGEEVHEVLKKKRENIVNIKENSGEKEQITKEEENIYVHQYHHYFYTKDDRYKTQDIIEAIGDLQDLKGKTKIFFIQACRGRAGVKEDNLDFGHDVAVVQSRGEQSNHKTEGVDKKDAIGYMPEEENNIEPDNEEETPITLAELHYDDCVVAFASMSGKYAYRKENDPNQGSWLLRALHTTMIEQNKLEDTVHILDVLTGVNREVSIQEACTKDYKMQLKAQSCFLHNLTCSDETLQFRFHSSPTST